MKGSVKYDSSTVVQLEGLEMVRKKIGMYVGSNYDPTQVITEQIVNSLDELQAGFGNKIIITLHKDGSESVRDFGRGMPYDWHKKYNINTLDLLMTKLNAGGKMESNDVYVVSGGTYGIGAKIGTATAQKLTVDIFRGDEHVHREYSKGEPIGKLEIKKNVYNEPTGTLMRYWPENNKDIWLNTEFNYNKIRNIVKDFAYFFPQATIELIDERINKKEEFHFEQGILDMLDEITPNKKEVILEKPFYINETLNGIPGGLEVAFTYTVNSTENVNGYGNNLRVVEGGTHVQGFRIALTKAINNAARDLGVLKGKAANFSGNEVKVGLVAVISAKLTKPYFENQTKTKLCNEELVGDFSSIVYAKLKNWLEDNPAEALKICSIIMATRNANNAAKRAREISLDTTKSNKKDFIATISDKYAGCKSKKPEEIELIIVEGDSAAGICKQARNAHYQAIYGIKGKSLNVETATLEKMLANKEFIDLINIIGTGISDDFDINKLKFGKIIILTDSDSDGAHIRTLLLTFFFRIMPQLIEKGVLYCGVTPLFKVSYGSTYKYCADENEKDKFLKTLGSKYSNVVVSRFKGLGEMDAEDLRESTLDMQKRRLLKYKVTDLSYTDMVLNKLMGSDAKHKKLFIEEGII